MLSYIRFLSVYFFFSKRNSFYSDLLRTFLTLLSNKKGNKNSRKICTILSATHGHIIRIFVREILIEIVAVSQPMPTI